MNVGHIFAAVTHSIKSITTKFLTNMKNFFLTAAFCILGLLGASAQTELKINPLGLLFGSPDLSAEFGLSNSTSLEPFVGFTSRNSTLGIEDWKYSAVNAGASFKYFFNPHRGIDRFYAGIYTRFNTGSWKFDEEKLTSQRLSLGLLIGQKWVSRKNIVFELAIGAGRAFLNTIDDGSGGEDYGGLLFDLDIMGRLAVGYRFGGGKDK